MTGSLRKWTHLPVEQYITWIRTTQFSIVQTHTPHCMQEDQAYSKPVVQDSYIIVYEAIHYNINCINIQIFFILAIIQRQLIWKTMGKQTLGIRDRQAEQVMQARGT